MYNTKSTICLLLINVFGSNASLLFFSTKHIEIPALKKLNNNEFKKLFDHDHVTSIKVGIKGKLHPELVQYLIENIGKYTSYVPEEDISLENSTVLTGDLSEDIANIEQALQSEENGEEKDKLIIYWDASNRQKRTASDELQSTDTPTNSMRENASGPVVYIPNTKEAIIYSSKPLLLKIANTTDIYLAEAKVVTSNTIKKMSLKIIRASFIRSEDKNKLFLNFVFPYTETYWFMNRVEVEMPDGNKFNLTTKSDITARKAFSYHCGGETVFTDPASGVELYLYEMQVQLNTTTSRFSDAYDCIPFTTGPIWSGLFVTSILGIGLIIALTAIGSIKTMDKFDNHKTKQLSITVSE